MLLIIFVRKILHIIRENKMRRWRNSIPSRIDRSTGRKESGGRGGRPRRGKLHCASNIAYIYAAGLFLGKHESALS